MTEYRIYLSDIIYVLHKNFKYIVLLGIIGLLMGIMVYAAERMLGTNSVSYTISVSYYVTSEVDDAQYANGGTNPNLSDINMINNMIDSVVYFCRSSALTDKVAEKAGLTGVDGNQIGRALSVSRYESTQIVQLSLSWSNREEGEKIVEAIGELLPELLKQTMKTGGIEPVDLPKTIEVRQETSTKLVFIIAALGFALGIAVCVLPLFVRPTIISLDRVEDMLGIPRVGDIPETPVPGKIDSAELQNSVYRESVVSAAHIIMHQIQSQEKRCSSIYFTSAQAGEGKTLLVANIGIALSNLGVRTVLLDLSMNNPKLSNVLVQQVDARKSLNAVYYYETELQKAIVRINERLDILPTAVEKIEPEINARIGEIVEELSEIYDLVLIDSAALGQSSDSLSLNTIADSIIFVAHFDDVPVSVLKYNIEKLHKTGAPILGCMVNGVPEVSFNKVGMTSKVDDTAAKNSKRWISFRHPESARKKKTELPASEANLPKEQFQRVMEAMDDIDSNMKETMLLDMLGKLEEILDNHSIALYTVESGMRYARLTVSSSEIMTELPKSIQLSDYKEILRIVGKHEVYSSSEINHGFPMFVAGIFGEQQLDVLIMIYHVTALQFNRDYHDTIKMSCDIFQVLYSQMLKRTALSRKFEYEADSGIMEATRFRQLIETYTKIREKQMGQFILIRLGHVNKWNINTKLQGHIRSSDVLGYDELGNIYLFLAQMNEDAVELVLKRLKLIGIYEYEITESLPAADQARKKPEKVTNVHAEKPDTVERQHAPAAFGDAAGQETLPVPMHTACESKSVPVPESESEKTGLMSDVVEQPALMEQERAAAPFRQAGGNETIPDQKRTDIEREAVSDKTDSGTVRKTEKADEMEPQRITHTVKESLDRETVQKRMDTAPVREHAPEKTELNAAGKAEEKSAAKAERSNALGSKKFRGILNDSHGFISRPTIHEQHRDD